jgi:metallophosphoesterase (TIGR03767 family)
MTRRTLEVLVGTVLVVMGLGSAGATPVTTVVQTVQDTDGDDRLEYAPGEDYEVLNGPDDFRPSNSSILNFLHMTDFQLVDEESPARVEFFDTTQRGPFSPFASAYRPQESLTTQVTEAMVRSAANTVSPITQERLEFTILTGDNADSQQYNETRWFIDILDGHKKIDPNSGIPTPACPGQPGSVYDGVQGGGDAGYYDPDASGPGTDGDGYSPEREQNFTETGRRVTMRDFPGLFEAANQPFQAVGLDMPWYSAFGNHDALVQGNSPDAYAGPFGASGETSKADYQGIATGCFKPMIPPPSIPDPTDFFGGLPGAEIVPPDPRRCFLAKDEPGFGTPFPCSTAGWIEQHFLTTGTPVGHGFTPGTYTGYGRPEVADEHNDGYYSFAPARGLRFVVLDTVTDECGSLFCSEGSVDDPQFEWLRTQIEAAAEAGEYVVVFSHHTLRTTRFVSTDPSEYPIHYGQRVDRMNPPNPQNVSLVTLEELYCEHPNVIAHVAGHEHENFIRHYRCEQDNPPTPGPGDFWHVSTAAHIDWPQQSRMIEFIDNGDSPTMSMVLTMLDHAGAPNPGNAKPDLIANGQSGEQVLKLASIARELAYNDYQASRGARGGPEDRNAIVVIDRPWPYPSD